MKAMVMLRRSILTIPGAKILLQTFSCLAERKDLVAVPRPYPLCPWRLRVLIRIVVQCTAHSEDVCIFWGACVPSIMDALLGWHAAQTRPQEFEFARSFAMPKAKRPKSNAMMQRIAGMEGKIASMLKRAAPARVPRGGQRSRAVTGPNRGPLKRDRVGRLGLGGGSRQGVTTRRGQTVEGNEYIGEITSSELFSVTQLAINPGQNNTFPWASKIASLYEEYEFELLEFIYKREVSEFATVGTQGKIIFSIDYDASDPAPVSKQQMEDTDPHIDGMPCDQMIVLKADCAQMRKNLGKYVRPGGLPVNTDIKTYDSGNCNVAVYGNTSNGTVMGELHVHYRVRFSKPVLELGTGLLCAHIVEYPAGTAEVAERWGSGLGQTRSGTTIPIAVTNTTFSLPYLGQYLVSLILSGSVNSAGTLSFGANITGVMIVIDNSSAGGGSVTGGTSYSTYIVDVTVAGTGAANTVTIANGAAQSSGSTDLFVCQMPSGMLSPPPKNEAVGRVPPSTLLGDEGAKAQAAEVEDMFRRMSELGLLDRTKVNCASASAAAAVPLSPELGWDVDGPTPQEASIISELINRQKAIRAGAASSGYLPGAVIRPTAPAGPVRPGPLRLC